MRRFLCLCAVVAASLGVHKTPAGAQQPRPQQSPTRQATPATAETPRLQRLTVPPSEARSLATKLTLMYRDVPGVRISPDARDGQLVIMAPQSTHVKIAADVRDLIASSVATVSAEGPYRQLLKNITWREFEDDLMKLTGGAAPVTTSRNGERAAFQLTSAPMEGTTVEVDRRENAITIVAPGSTLVAWQRIIDTVDQVPRRSTNITELIRLENSEPAPIQRALRLLGELKGNAQAMPAVGAVPFRRAVFQQDGNAQAGVDQGTTQAIPTGEAESGSGVIGDTEIQFVPELGVIIIRGAKRDVERVRSVIDEIEKQSEVTRPAIEVVTLEHADSNAVATLLQQLYEDVLSARQGDVSITALDSPNALLLIGRDEAILGLMDLIKKIDQPVDESSRLRVFRLQHASANDAVTTIQEFFVDRPGSSDDLRPGLGIRVRVIADYRTNSLIVSASPRDMEEVTRLVNELDVQNISATNEIKIFPLTNALAEDLATVLQDSINGVADGGNENATAPSTTLSIVSLDPDGNSVLDSGLLTGAVITADANANALVVRAPSASMSLIGELIRQLDKAPGVDSFVKVFTIENGDATQLTTALESLFGTTAATAGTSVGAANLAGLSTSTAGDSSLVPLRFSTDIRTNSIIASGSGEDLEVVESILLRLDSEGFAERITEVIWLRHQQSDGIATAITDYVSQRTQGVNSIQQFQQGGLGPYDLPDRDLIVVSEPVSNSILLSVSPRLYEDVRRLIDKLDRRPPMVLIKVVIAEVTLNDLFEIGGELGLQDSLLYDRGVASSALTPANSFPPSTDPATISGNQPRNGFNFNGLNTPNANSLGQGNVASRGVTALGVGTASSVAQGSAGFVLTAASESINVLFRSLQTASRMQIISRPQIMTVDNTVGFVQVGQTVARPNSVNINQNTTSIGVTDVEVGLILQVTPRVGADGLIVLLIQATRSAINNTDPGTAIGVFADGTPVTVQPIDKTEAQSTLTAYNNQTVVFGGLIQKTRSNISRRVPYLADIPLLGYFFKYDQESEVRKELLVVMTPMIVTGEEDLEYIKATESNRMSYCLADVVEAHGDVGLQPGYGLWGPAVGQTIYPDMQPTVDHMYQSPTDGLPPGAKIISETPINESILDIGPTFDSGASFKDAPSLIESAAPLDSSSLLDAPVKATGVETKTGTTMQGVATQASIDPNANTSASLIPRAEVGSNRVPAMQASWRLSPSRSTPNQQSTALPEKLPALVPQTGK